MALAHVDHVTSLALLNPEMSVVIQKFSFYSGNLK